jgi:hypothetical protein
MSNTGKPLKKAYLYLVYFKLLRCLLLVSICLFQFRVIGKHIL